MRTPMDDLKDKFQFERDQLQEKLGTLEVERGTLQDTLAGETRPVTHERLEELPAGGSRAREARPEKS